MAEAGSRASGCAPGSSGRGPCTTGPTRRSSARSSPPSFPDLLRDGRGGGLPPAAGHRALRHGHDDRARRSSPSSRPCSARIADYAGAKKRLLARLPRHRRRRHRGDVLSSGAGDWKFAALLFIVAQHRRSRRASSSTTRCCPTSRDARRWIACRARATRSATSAAACCCVINLAWILKPHMFGLPRRRRGDHSCRSSASRSGGCCSRSRCSAGCPSRRCRPADATCRAAAGARRVPAARRDLARAARATAKRS